MDDLCQIEETLPANTSKGTRVAIRSIAHRLERIADLLGNEADQPEPSSSLLRKLAWLGVGVAWLIPPIVSGIAEALAGEVAAERLAAVEQQVQSSCGRVLDATTDATIGPSGLLMPPVNPMIVSCTAETY